VLDLVTESVLDGAFEFQGTCTTGDDSCNTGSRSMGAGFCNFDCLGWNTQIPLSLPLLQEQHTLHASKVGREDEGVSSNRPELVALVECLDSHEDNINLLYLTDSEATLQAIRKWIGYGAKLNLSKYRGDPLNEEADIRAEMGHSKEQKKVILDKSHFEH
jgi:hypothetical protein